MSAQQILDLKAQIEKLSESLRLAELAAAESPFTIEDSVAKHDMGIEQLKKKIEWFEAVLMANSLI